MTEIFNEIEAHEEQTRRLDAKLLAERDATQARIEQLISYRHELDEVIRRRGIRPNAQSEYVNVPTNDPRIVKRTPREKVEYVASVPVESVAETPSVRQAIVEVCSDGQKRTNAEIFDAVLLKRPGTNYPTFVSIFHKLDMRSGRNDRPNAKKRTRLYWLPSVNTNKPASSSA